MTNNHFPLVSVLFITYKRYEMLERSFHSFLENTDYPNLQLVIADDGSGPEIQAQIRNLPANIFALAPKNRGLGANNNNGLRHCTGKYVLIIQDDCICSGPPDYLKNTILVMETNPNIGIVNYAGAPHPIDDIWPWPAARSPATLRPGHTRMGRWNIFSILTSRTSYREPQWNRSGTTLNIAIWRNAKKITTTDGEIKPALPPQCFPNITRGRMCIMEKSRVSEPHFSVTGLMHS
ncbi:MAG: glycosyltransferase family 2 protein [Silvibacterium sp.]